MELGLRLHGLWLWFRVSCLGFAEKVRVAYVRRTGPDAGLEVFEGRGIQDVPDARCDTRSYDAAIVCGGVWG